MNVGSVSWLSPRFPASCPFRVVHIHSLPGAMSGTCFASANSLWLAPLAPPSPQVVTHPNRCSKASQLLWGCQTSRIRTSLSCSLRIHSADPDATQGQMRDLPAPVYVSSVRARGLGPRGGGTALAMTICSVLPSVTNDAVGPPKLFYFRGSIPGPHVTLSTLRCCPRGQRRMTRGQCGSRFLH